MLPLLIAALLATGAPAAAPCACLCGMVEIAGRPAPSPAERARIAYDRADGAFVGRVIASRRVGGINHHTFAVRQSWKGVEEDTAHVAVPESMGCEPVYWPGQSYLVLAKRTPDGFRPPECTTAIPADSTQLAVYLPVMGTPRRSFPADTIRSIEALVPPSAPYVSGATRVHVSVFRGGRGPHAGVRVSVAGTGLSGSTDTHGSVFFSNPSPGWYRFRFEFADGGVHEEYGLVRCPDGTETCTYDSLRFFLGPDAPGS